MHHVAIVAGDTGVLVLAARPVVAVTAFVAAHALVGPLTVARGRIHALLEHVVGRRAAFSADITLEMLCAAAVAGLAIGRTRVTAYAVLGLVETQDRRGFALVMALGANAVFL